MTDNTEWEACAPWASAAQLLTVVYTLLANCIVHADVQCLQRWKTVCLGQTAQSAVKAQPESKILTWPRPTKPTPSSRSAVGILSSFGTPQLSAHHQSITIANCSAAQGSSLSASAHNQMFFTTGSANLSESSRPPQKRSRGFDETELSSVEETAR